MVTRLVEVSVVAQDKQGQPVTDLTREDFILLEDSREHPIKVFVVESDQQRPASAPPLPAGTYSNRLEHRRGVPTSVTAILFDGLNTPIPDQVYARGQIIKFLQQLQPQDRVALYALGQRLRVLHDFTSDASLLLRALDRYKGRPGTELDTTTPSGFYNEVPATESFESGEGEFDIEAWLGETGKKLAYDQASQRIGLTLQAIEAIANHLAQLPGRKNLVWVSAGFPLFVGKPMENMQTHSAPEFRPQIDAVERALRAVNDCNLAIYPVDARGLIVRLTVHPRQTLDSRGRPLPAIGPVNVVTTSELGATHDTMRLVADRTGGEAFYNTNDIKGAVREAIDDSRATYLLGYYPQHAKWNGEYHRITVKVKRAGLRIRHRRGYYAFAHPRQDVASRRAALRDALWSPLDSTALGLTVRLAPAAADTTDAEGLNVALQVDPSNVTLAKSGDAWRGSLDILLVLLSAEGEAVSTSYKPFDLNLRPEDYEKLQRGMTLTTRLGLVAGAERLRVVVRDAESGAMGSLTAPLPR
ncbi:MAG: VWA domain-containing protein [Candidatus Acidiferrales bacterium]